MFLPGWDNISRVNDMLMADPVFRSSETLQLQPECLANYTHFMIFTIYLSSSLHPSLYQSSPTAPHPPLPRPLPPHPAALHDADSEPAVGL